DGFGRLVVHHLNLERIRAHIELDGVQPLVHRGERLVDHGRSDGDAVGGGPDEVVAVTAVVPIETLPQAQAAPVRVDTAVHVIVSAQIDDRYLGELPAVAYESTGIEGVQYGWVRLHAGWYPVPIRVISAHALVQLHELLGRNGARLQ